MLPVIQGVICALELATVHVQLVKRTPAILTTSLSLELINALTSVSIVPTLIPPTSDVFFVIPIAKPVLITPKNAHPADSPTSEPDYTIKTIFAFKIVPLAFIKEPQIILALNAPTDVPLAPTSD